MKESQALDILEKVLGFADAEAVEAVITGGPDASTRFADNLITQNVQTSDTTLNVMCAYGQSHGSASTNGLSEESLKSLIQRAQAIAKVSPPDPEYMPPVEPGETEKYPGVDAYFEKTASFAPLEKAQQISSAAATVKAKGLRLSGAYSTEDSFIAVANSAGLRAYHRETRGEIHTTVLGADGSGWAEKIAPSVEDISVEEVVSTALDIAKKAQDPADPEAGKYTVIMSPAAIGELLMFLFWGGFDAKAADEGRTFMRGKLGQKVAGENITIRSDPAEPRCPSQPFLGDGLVAPRLSWIEKGVTGNLAYSRFWAAKKGKEATGNPTNIIMDGGGATVDEMIASTKKGLLITRFWYIRTVDPMVPLVTGMTRDGLFLIENGKVTRPLKNMRFNDNPLDLLSRVEALGRPERTGEYVDMLVPPLAVRDFNFTSTTKF